MRLARARIGERIATGAVEDGVVRPLAGTFFENPVPTGEEVPLEEARLLAPAIPSKIVCVARNYAAHAEELGNAPPEEPMLFLKPSTALIGPGDAIPLPPVAERVDHEAEIAVVIGRLCRKVSPEEAPGYILGYTCANDVTARDLQKKDGQWGRAKGFDGFCPLGPWVETDVDLNDAEVLCRVNGEVRQSGRTSAMTRTPAELVAWISQVMTLLPGDVVLTGTPSGVSPLSDGDVVEIDIEGIGVLENPVAARG
ncbi:MAG TPA: fumarylacetoacetate hydrolase family protein [Actinomycetota bacterium]|nr:fumarylacetoacetate hydrolase family protein [Actinomycetota bacterium]